MNFTRPQQVRRVIAHVFAELRSTTEKPQETLLIRGGHYCGHRYQVEDVSAIWFLEEDEIKVYGPNGDVLRVIESPQIDSGTSCPGELPGENDAPTEDRRTQAA